MVIEKEKFEELGDLSKLIRRQMFELVKNSQSVGLKKKEVDKLVRSIKYLDEFRSAAENKMFAHGYIDEHVFYGDGE